MSIFEPLTPHLWRPSPLAAGPFAGLQGGAVAGLLTAELEAMGSEKGWGCPLSATAWSLRPAPMHQHARLQLVDSTLRRCIDFGRSIPAPERR
jgi:hypothetical protein